MNNYTEVFIENPDRFYGAADLIEVNWQKVAVGNGRRNIGGPCCVYCGSTSGFLPRSEYSQRILKDGDSVKFMLLVGGG
jgi:hypothetical protein